LSSPIEYIAFNSSYEFGGIWDEGAVVLLIVDRQVVVVDRGAVGG
jgi:hypothetical protein